MGRYDSVWQLNQVSLSDAYSMPGVDDLIDRVGKSTYTGKHCDFTTFTKT